MVVFTPVSRWVPDNKWLLKVTYGKARLPDDMHIPQRSNTFIFIGILEVPRILQV